MIDDDNRITGALEAELDSMRVRVGASAAILTRQDGTVVACVGAYDSGTVARLAKSACDAMVVAGVLAGDLELKDYVEPDDGGTTARLYVRLLPSGRRLVTVFDAGDVGGRPVTVDPMPVPRVVRAEAIAPSDETDVQSGLDSPPSLH